MDDQEADIVSLMRSLNYTREEAERIVELVDAKETNQCQMKDADGHTQEQQPPRQP